MWGPNSLLMAPKQAVTAISLRWRITGFGWQFDASAEYQQQLGVLQCFTWVKVTRGMAQAFSCNFCFAEVTLEDEPGKQTSTYGNALQFDGDCSVSSTSKAAWGRHRLGRLCALQSNTCKGGGRAHMEIGHRNVLGTWENCEEHSSEGVVSDALWNSTEFQFGKKSNPFEGAFAKCFIFFHRQMPAERRWPWLQVAFMQVSFLVPRPWEFGMWWDVRVLKCFLKDIDFVKSLPEVQFFFGMNLCPWRSRWRVRLDNQFEKSVEAEVGGLFVEEEDTRTLFLLLLCIQLCAFLAIRFRLRLSISQPAEMQTESKVQTAILWFGTVSKSSKQHRYFWCCKSEVTQIFLLGNVPSSTGEHDGLAFGSRHQKSHSGFDDGLGLYCFPGIDSFWIHGTPWLQPNVTEFHLADGLRSCDHFCVLGAVPTPFHGWWDSANSCNVFGRKYCTTMFHRKLLSPLNDVSWCKRSCWSSGCQYASPACRSESCQIWWVLLSVWWSDATMKQHKRSDSKVITWTVRPLL